MNNKPTNALHRILSRITFTIPLVIGVLVMSPTPKTQAVQAMNYQGPQLLVGVTCRAGISVIKIEGYGAQDSRQTWTSYPSRPFPGAIITVGKTWYGNGKVSATLVNAKNQQINKSTSFNIPSNYTEKYYNVKLPC